ncbi:MULTISPECIES: hypothetical protein [Snodgrassella]|uniref:hypothetical protein n=1 Tax=Snodgrassella TaxID=1193515 RepID=UPI0008161505|nr:MULTISPECIES: hypothetical protein [Snodgrassella]MCO6506490.1 hypothetical protein [Snodgrassella sp.]MCO6525132.1 hypothetical protein [Snodgrassella sp.]SCB81473.1 hypothetical protein GA0061082_10225 [Snodgrassella sp. R-53583]
MFEKIANYLRTRKLIKELVILLVSYAVFILGTVGWYYFDNCEQGGSCAFLGICGLINFFVYLTIVNYKTIKSIFSRSNDNNSPSFKALLIQLTLFVLVFLSFFYGCGYLLVSFDIGFNPESMLTAIYIWILFFLLCCCISLFILFVAKTIKCLFLRSTNNNTAY